MHNHPEDRDAAIRWARAMLAQPMIFLDTETTGLSSRDEVVQLGAVEIMDGEITRTHSRYYLPAVVPEPEAVARTGLDLDALRLKDAAWFGEDFPRLWRLLAHTTVVAYNAAFDRRMLEQTCEAHRLPVPPATWHCAMEQYAAYYGDWNDYHHSYRWQKLAVACERHGLHIPGTQAHEAVGDTLSTLALVRHMAGQPTSEEAAEEAAFEASLDTQEVEPLAAATPVLPETKDIPF